MPDEGKVKSYSVRVVLTGTVVALSRDEAYEVADYDAGSLSEHEVEIEEVEVEGEA